MQTNLLPAATELPSNLNRGKALIVDDNRTNRTVLKAQLKNAGYQVIEAENGAIAVELFSTEHPDIVFMDIMMPVMDGYEATEKIKALCGTTFIPIIFITALTDHESMAAAIRSGGDDFFVKPFDLIILKSKILAMERLRELYRTTHDLYNHLKRDQEFAEILFNKAVTAGNVALDMIKTQMQPASTFNGDMLLTEHSLSFDLHVILGDVTGHGLTTALGVLPSSEVFRAMCRKGFAMPEILASINRKLHSLLPTGMFLAAQYVKISCDLNYVTICNCGMPDILILDGTSGKIKSRVKSIGLPLGVVQEVDYKPLLQRISIQPGDRIILTSNGVSEAQDPHGEMFGLRRFETAITQRQNGDHLASLNNVLNDFCQNSPQTDDISIVEIPCVAEVLPASNLPPQITTEVLAEPDPPPDSPTLRNSWQYRLDLVGSKLRTVNPVPLIIAQLQELEDIGTHHQTLYTILTELYVNALDHGLLQLESSLKQSPEGFSEYFNKREKRLKELQDGWISFSLKVKHSGSSGRIQIRIDDSGEGFNFNNDIAVNDNNGQLHGRGILLIRELCESVHYIAPGNRVEAVFGWSDCESP